MLSKSRFLGLHLRVDKGCLLGKQGTNLWAGLTVGALGYQGSGKIDVWMYMYMCYICMYVFMCVCLCSEARCVHDMSSSVILHPIF